MTSLRINKDILEITISNEKISFVNSKNMIRKARRMIKQNSSTTVIIEIDKTSSVNKSALGFYNKVLNYSNDFHIVLICA